MPDKISDSESVPAPAGDEATGTAAEGTASQNTKSAETRERSFHDILGGINRTGFVAVFLALLIAVYWTAKTLEFVPQLMQDILLGVVAAVAMHLLDRIWLHRDTQDELQRIGDQIVVEFKGIKKEIQGQIVDEFTTAEGKIVNRVSMTTELLKADLDKAINVIPTGAKSLEAMRNAGAGQLYSCRHEASIDISRDFDNPNTIKIRLIGVSFHDTLRRSGADELGPTWEQIFNHITGGRTYSEETDIKLLVIDPRCQGALLRAEGESRVGGKFVPGGLQADVREAIQPLLELQREAQKNGVKFEARIYRTSPILFLCWNERVAYTQQYFFWSERAKADDARMPMIRFDCAKDDHKSVHSELEQHFNWIWEHASIDLESYKTGHEIGVDEGIWRAGIANIYADPADGRKRIAHLLSTAKRNVCIQGISLHSYFAPGELRLAVQRLLFNNDIKLGIYFLNPECEQAKLRAFREMCLRKKIAWHTYDTSPTMHKRSTLYRETINARNQLAEMMSEIAGAIPSWNATKRVECGFYKTAPSCFVLQVDDTVLVEQYHYGKLISQEHETRVVLGMDLPLIEYKKERSQLFKGAAPPAYELLCSHLEFVAEQSDKFEAGWWNKLQPVEED